MLNGADEQDMIDHIRSSQLGTARPATRGTAGIDPERRAPPSQDHRIHSSRAAPPRVVCGANRRERLLTVEICECTASTHQDHGRWSVEVLTSDTAYWCGRARTVPCACVPAPRRLAPALIESHGEITRRTHAPRSHCGLRDPSTSHTRDTRHTIDPGSTETVRQETPFNGSFLINS